MYDGSSGENHNIAAAGLRVIGLAGEPFMSGTDVSEFGRTRGSIGATATYNAALEDAYAALLDCRKPTLAIGFVNQVVPTAEFARRCAVLCAAIAENAPLSITAAKHAIRAALGDPGAKELKELQAEIDACRASEDYEEGRTAFREKRKPQFKGR